MSSGISRADFSVGQMTAPQGSARQCQYFQAHRIGAAKSAIERYSKMPANGR